MIDFIAIGVISLCCLIDSILLRLRIGILEEIIFNEKSLDEEGECLTDA